MELHFGGRPEHLDWCLKFASEFSRGAPKKQWWPHVKDIQVTCGPLLAAVTVEPMDDDNESITWRSDITAAGVPHWGEAMDFISLRIAEWRNNA